MKTLPEILRDVILLLDNGREHVVIARGHNEPSDGRDQAYQIRLRREEIVTRVCKYTCEVRSWLGRQWSSWSVHHGWLGGASFAIDDVLATDWRIAS